MAFDIRNLSEVRALGNNRWHWHYFTTDSLATCLATDYFSTNSGLSRLHRGDVLEIVASTAAESEQVTVSSVAGSSVTLLQSAAGTVSDAGLAAGLAGTASSAAAQQQARVARRADGVINVMDPFFGVVGDDSNDDTAGIQAAIDTGHAVFFPRPPSAYKVTAPLLIKRDGVRLIGAGRKYTAIKNYAAGTVLLKSDNVQLQRFSCELDGLICQNVNYNGVVLDFTGVMFVSVRESWVYAQGGNTSIGIWLAGARTGANVYPTDGTYAVISHTYFGNSIRGVRVAEDANHTLIDACRFQPLTGGWAIEVNGQDTNQPNSVLIRDCSIEFPGNVSNGVYCDICEAVSIQNLRAEQLSLVIYLTANCRKPVIINPYADSCTTVLTDLGALNPCYFMPKEGIYAFPNLPTSAPTSGSKRIWVDTGASNVIKMAV